MNNIIYIATVEKVSAASESTHEDSTVESSAVLLNVGFQIVNILIFFFVFKHFFGKKILASFEERKTLLNKLKSADDEYNQLIEKAHQEKNQIVEEGKTIKDSIVKDAQQLATKKGEDILESANKKSEDIIKKANLDAEQISNELTQNWESSVKTTAKAVVKKLIEKDVELNQQYLDTIVGEFSKTK
ncbi:MAG: hypothetical protein V3575_01610 [Candidatus Absconditabacteria bacterium]